MWFAKMCLAVGQNVCLVCVLVAMVCPGGQSNHFEQPSNLYNKRSARFTRSETANTSTDLLEQTISDNSKFFMQKLFQKYGANGQMTFEGFEHFLENLGLGNIKITGHFLEDHKSDTEFEKLHHEDHNHQYVNESHEESHDHQSSHDHHDHEERTRKKREQLSAPIQSKSTISDTKLRQKRSSQLSASKRHKRQEGHDHAGHGTHDHGSHNDSGSDDDHGSHDHGSHDDKESHGDLDHKSDHNGHNSQDLTTESKLDKESTTSATTPKLRKNRKKLSRKHQRLLKAQRKKDVEKGVASNRSPKMLSPQSKSISQMVRVGCAEGDSSCTQQCLSAKELMLMFDLPISGDIREMSFLQMCPVIMYQIDSRSCDSGGAGYKGSQPLPSDYDDHSGQDHHSNHSQLTTLSPIPAKVWGYSLISVLIISAVGLLSVAVIPIIDKVFYNHLLQFLVALAVGALSGDALLHLIPHAMELSSEDSSHGSHEDEESHGHNNKTVWIGLMALAGIYTFFMLERIVTIITEIKNKKKRLKKQSSPLLLEESNLNSVVGAKLSGHEESCDEMVLVVHPNKAIKEFATSTHTVVHECEEDHHDTDGKVEYEEVMTSLTSGHEHGHGHGHGHSHEVPNSVAAVAWMVILGDGIHNFTDGLAIGAAFASSVTGGISTSIAIFCHELPHEIGDFAVLIRAGMSIKQALVYNCLSSVLCLAGMFIGVPLGNLDNSSMWIFAMVGGMFIYIAFVDMLPEMTSVDTKQGEHPFCHLIVQVLGMLVGAGIMLLIAIYEHDIKTSLDP